MVVANDNVSFSSLRRETESQGHKTACDSLALPPHPEFELNNSESQISNSNGAAYRVLHDIDQLISSGPRHLLRKGVGFVCIQIPKIIFFGAMLVATILFLGPVLIVVAPLIKFTRASPKFVSDFMFNFGDMFLALAIKGLITFFGVAAMIGIPLKSFFLLKSLISFKGLVIGVTILITVITWVIVFPRLAGMKTGINYNSANTRELPTKGASRILQEPPGEDDIELPDSEQSEGDEKNNANQMIRHRGFYHDDDTDGDLL